MEARVRHYSTSHQPVADKFLHWSLKIGLQKPSRHMIPLAVGPQKMWEKDGKACGKRMETGILAKWQVLQEVCLFPKKFTKS